jgi:Na+/H+ antiporter NhaA
LTDLLVVGVVASIGFTVSLFFATAAFPVVLHSRTPKWAYL